MLLFFVLFIFFIFHVQFLLKNVFFGIDEAQFFNFVVRYQFDQSVALKSLLFTLACAGSFAICYKLLYRTRKFVPDCNIEVDLRGCRVELLLLNTMGLAMLSYILVIGGMTGFSYGPMTQLREGYGFIFELRMIYLVLLAHILFNVPWKLFLSRPELKLARLVLWLYFIALLLFQARSAVFELAVVVIFPLLMWAGDRVKLIYLFLVCCLLLVPNVIVLGRMGIPDDPYELIDGLFSIEYTVLLNKFLGAAIENGYSAADGLSFLPQLGLILPSPLRNLLGISAVNTDYIEELSDAAEVFGGGFSFLAQTYTDFGWSSPLVFGLLGLLIGRVNSRAAQVGHVKLVYAAAPLLYSMFLLTFRNDFGVFIKYTVQLFVVSFLLSVVLKNRLGKG